MVRTKLWLAAYLFFVVYGSLVPLEYRPIPLDVAWQRFSEAPFLRLGVESRADWIANGVLYLPLGLLTALVLRQFLGLPWWIAGLLAWLASVSVALVVEFAQVFFPPRSVSRNDLLSEAIGSGLGALIAPWIGGWLERARAALFAHHDRLFLLALKAYAALYVVLCLFPYDVLISTSELRAKIDSGAWGWLLAPTDRSSLIVLIKLALEVLLSMPIGVLLGRRWPRLSPLAALAAGAGFGIAIELGQFLIASGISQGLSAFARAVGVVLGAALPQRLPDDLLLRVRLVLRRLTWPLLAIYLAVLAAVNGLLTRSWHGAAGAAATWESVHLLPFYYHYYTTEAAAVVSLTSVILMYLPLALLAWAHRLSRTATVMLVAIAATAIEFCKLFVVGRHPDPTSILIAAGTSWLVLCTLDRLRADALKQNASAARSGAVSASWLGGGTLVAALAIAWAATFPSHRLLLVVVLSLAAIATWRRPVLALAIVPAALPALDLAPWTGRFYFDEFDLLQAVCLFVALHRIPSSLAARRPLPLVLFSLVGLGLLLSVLRALLPLQSMDANSFYSYYSHYNALRIAKGAVWTIPFVILWQRIEPRQDAQRAFTAGMSAGLAWTVLWILWERATFVGLADFASDFRVSGPFSAMHKGGGYLECYLVVASAFTLTALLQSRTAGARVAAFLLLGGAAYATMVTYSRGGYAAFATVLLLTTLGSLVPALRSGKHTGLSLLLALGAILTAITVAVPVLSGSFARERLARTGEDLSARQTHWENALDLRDEDYWTTVFGEGLGRFPETHFWRSQEAPRAATYRLMHERDKTFLRLAPGAALYVEQLLQASPMGPLFVELRYRTASPDAALSFALCRKWLLNSQACVRGRTSPGERDGGWREVKLPLGAAPLGKPTLLPPAPLVFSLFTPDGAKVIDVAGVRLLDAQGVDLLANGDFASGLDRWFFTTDVSQPWYIDNLPVSLLFDGGWFLLLAWGALVGATLVYGAVLVWRGHAEVNAAWPALVGFLVCGWLNTLIDNPRFLWLFLALTWMTMLDAAAVRGPSLGRAAIAHGLAAATERRRHQAART